jgi:hypothetical protein
VSHIVDIVWDQDVGKGKIGGLDDEIFAMQKGVLSKLLEWIKRCLGFQFRKRHKGKIGQGVRGRR